VPLVRHRPFERFSMRFTYSLRPLSLVRYHGIYDEYVGNMRRGFRMANSFDIPPYAVVLDIYFIRRSYR